MVCFHYFIFFCFFNCQFLQVNAFDEEHNDIFAELWQKSEKYSTESGKCEETLQNSNDNFISQKIGKIKKENFIKDEPNNNNNNYEDFKFDKFSNERQQKIALNKIIKEENVEKRVKSEFIEFDRISDKEEFDNGKNGEEHNDIFAELWQKSDENGTKFGKCEKTLRTNSNDNLISQKIGKIQKEIVVKDEPNDHAFKFDQFSNQKPQNIATVKEENVDKRVKSEFMEFDRISDKEEFDNGKDGEKQSTDSIFDNSNLKESSSKSQKGIKKIYSEVEKQEIIAEFDKLKKEFKTRAKGMSYNMKKIDKKIAQKLGVDLRIIYSWKSQFGVSKKQKKYTDAKKVELLKNFNKTKKENPQLRNDEIAQMLNIHIKTLNRWERKLKGLIPEKRMKYTDAEKVELLKNFNKIKKENPQLRNVEIAQMLNIHIKTLNCWERKSKGLEPGNRKFYSEVEKRKIIAEFDKLKKLFTIRAKGRSYHMEKIDKKIAQIFGVSRSTINNWKKQFGVSMDNGGPIGNVQRPDGSEGSTSSVNALNDKAWKWNDFRKKRNERIGKILFKS